MRSFRLVLVMLAVLFCVTASLFAGDVVAESGTGWQDVVWGIAAIAIATFASTGIGGLVFWLKKQKWFTKLGIDNIVDKAAEIAVHYAESWGRAHAAADGAAKLNAAKNVFQAELKRQGVKLDAGVMETRLEAILNKLKDSVEHKEKKPE